MATGTVPVGDPAPEQIVDPTAEVVEEPPQEETPDYAAQLRDAQKQIDKIKSDFELSEQKAKFWHEQATSRPITTEPPPVQDNPFAALRDIDGYDVLTKEGQGLPALAQVFKEKGGFVTMADVQNLIQATVAEENNKALAWGQLYEEFPAIKTDKAFQEAVKDEAVNLTNDPYYKVLPEAARIRVAAANVELRRLREAQTQPPGETEAQRQARIAAQSAPKGGRPPLPTSTELTDEQKKFADQIGLSYENFQKYGGTLNMIGGR